MDNSLAYQLQTKEMELRTLFETIEAINENASEDHLYRIYQLTLRSRPNLQKLALYVFDEVWACKANFGTNTDYRYVELDETITSIKELHITQINDQLSPQFREFSHIIPIFHKSTTLAFAFLTVRKQTTPQELDFIEALSNIIIVAIENKKLVRRQIKQENLRKQLDIAKEVQSLLFPKKLPYNDRLKVTASYQPHHTVGGDYYDFVEIDDHKFLLCIADVSGKGVPAAILMSNFQAALRVLLRKKTPLREVVEELNYQIIQNARGENFITAFFAEYDFLKRTLTFVNAGHNPPFLFANNKIDLLNDGTTVLGGFEPLPFLQLRTIKNLDSFLLFCFTDGFTET